MYRSFAKPLIDFFIALVGLCVLAPFLVLLCIISSIAFIAPPLFIQKRLGKNQRVFIIFKIRSLRIGSSENEAPTAWGLFLRRYAFDELPQLINVLLGQMSLVGPRPLLSSYANKENELFDKRHEVKPGLTGWAQINGRDEISWEEKFKFDAEYVERMSFCFDWSIILRTAGAVFSSKNADSSAKNLTSRYDKGSK